MMYTSSVPEFLGEIYKLDKPEGARCFRGQANSEWRTVPSVNRDLRENAESNIISELTLESPDDFSKDTSMFRKLVRAQHFGLPTRLLDVSMNPLVALYFACADKNHCEKEGKLVVFDFKPNRVKFADSDAVSVISNLANLSDSERDCIRNEITNRDISINTLKFKKSFNKIRSVDRLIQFVRVEKPYFRPEINPIDIKKYYFVHPYKDNNRIVAQSGAFIIAGVLKFGALLEKSKGISTREIKIKKESKNIILEQLDRININRRVLFPEIENSSSYIRERWHVNPDSGKGSDSLFGDLL